MDISNYLIKAIGRKITITYNDSDGILRATAGILRGITQDIIHMTIFDDFATSRDFYLNKNACTLLTWVVEPE